MAYLLLAIYALFGSFGMVLMKVGGSKSAFMLDAGIINIRMSWQIIVGLLMYICSFLLWLFIIQRFRLTYISTVAYGLVYVMIAILSFFILHEPIPLKDVIGFAVILTGVVISSI